jgi:hypothetical protein
MSRKSIRAGVTGALVSVACALALAGPVSASGPGLFTASPNKLNCGAHLAGGVYGCGSVTFTNTTSQPLTIIGDNVEITGPNASDFGYNGSGFNIACASGVTIQPGQFCGINVVFSPSAAGRHSATLNLFDGTSDQPEIVRVTGRAL